MNCSRLSRLFLIAVLACPLLTASAADSVSTAPTNKPPPMANVAQFGTIQLFNGRNLDGLHVYLEDATADPAKTWMVKDGGILHTTGTPRGYIRTQIAYADYKLHVEWRWTNGPGNSGALLHIVNRDEIWPKGIEANMMAGSAGNLSLFWDARSKDEFVTRAPGRYGTGRLERPTGLSVEKPPGEWNSFDIVAAGDTLTVSVNGVEVNRLTGVMPSGGMIGLQAEGAATDFRNVTLTLLPPAKEMSKQVVPPPK